MTGDSFAYEWRGPRVHRQARPAKDWMFAHEGGPGPGGPFFKHKGWHGPPDPEDMEDLIAFRKAMRGGPWGGGLGCRGRLCHSGFCS